MKREDRIETSEKGSQQGGENHSFNIHHFSFDIQYSSAKWSTPMTLGNRLHVLVTIGFLALPLFSAAQLHNGLIYQQLLENWFTQQKAPILSLEGPRFDPFTPTIPTDSSASRRITLGFPEVQYVELPTKEVARTVQVQIQTEDSSLMSEILSYQDTLNQEAMRAVYRQSPKSLRGENPTLRARWAIPIMLIGGSVGGIVSLFYVRSR